MLKKRGNFLTSDDAKHAHSPTHSRNTLHNIQNACARFSTLVSINCLLNDISYAQQTQVNENKVKIKISVLIAVCRLTSLL